MRIILSEPRGFCAGVTRAIEVVERALKKFGSPIYVKHEIVHNKYVVEDLKQKGAIFIEDINIVPIGSVVIFSAHGVSEEIEDAAGKADLKVIDATCPLVKKVHKKAISYELEGYTIILIGHKGHPEVEGTSGRIKGEMLLVSSEQEAKDIVIDSDKIAYVTQTTLSLDDTKAIIAILLKRFPQMRRSLHGDDICYATQNRQDAVRVLAKDVDLLLVVGSDNSSNSNRLKDLALECGVSSYLVNDYKDLQKKWFNEITNVGITAGASAPEVLVEQLVEEIKKMVDEEVLVSNLNGKQENVRFLLPKEVRYSS